MTYDKVRPIFKREYKKVQTLFKPDKDVEEPQKKKVAKKTLLQESFMKLKAVEVSGSESTQETPSNDPKEMSEEDVQNMLEIVLVSEFKVEALQVKYPIIDWEIHTERSRTYWKIIRVGGITYTYQSFEDMLKGFNREDLVALWNLVKEKFSTTVPNVDKEKALWVELKRLFEPDADDVLWKLQRYMHYPITWKLHTNCGMHQVSSTTRRHDMFMLTEKDYPLSNVVMTLMLSVKLQVEEDNEIVRDLVMKIFMANKPKSRSFDTSSNQYKDANTLFEAIQARFGGNDATKKTQRTLLKQMYENFNAHRTDTNEVDTANIHVSTVNTQVSTVSSHDNTANLSNATVYDFLANQPNGSQHVHEDLEQIHEGDLEEMD
nr:hypothetical protein [Tanacetum cinerariifolium]